VSQAVQYQEDAEHDAKEARGARVDGEVTIDEGAPKATAKRGPLHGLLPADDADAEEASRIIHRALRLG
jgi:hypothetical protein